LLKLGELAPERRSERWECAHCGEAAMRPEPNLFSFNSPLGSCPTCRGFGNVLSFSRDLIVPDPGKTLREGALRPWAGSWRELAIAGPVLAELRSRLTFLERVDLGYLTLDRLSRTLSGGEAQRIELANALGANLADTLYVLDEPTVGLHPRDTHRLIEILEDLAGRGNTLVVVEHEPLVMRGAA